MIPRLLHDRLLQLATQYPVVTLTGPRQSGKTTLVRAAFSNRRYVSLEDPDALDFAQSDPRGFLAQFPDGAVFDEIQRAPHIFSYLQGIIDNSGKNGLFILTGSQQFSMIETITQSLAGRTALVTLLPFSASELRHVKTVPGLNDLLVRGFYPPLYDRSAEPHDWYVNYTSTYIERDVRSIRNIGSLSLFRKFLKLCAARSGQVVNLSEMGNDCGINHNTAKSWLSILEASYIVFLLRPYYRNFSKRLIKSPKLYFHDTGLLCSLLNIRNADSLTTSPHRGHVFETFVIGEIIKNYSHKGKREDLYYLRDKTGHEIDCVLERDGALVAIEIKAGETIADDYFVNHDFWKKVLPDTYRPYVIYGGSQGQRRERGEVLPWKSMDNLFD